MRRALIAAILILALVGLTLEPVASVNAGEMPGTRTVLTQFSEAGFQARAAQVIRYVACQRDPAGLADPFLKFDAERKSEDPSSNEDLMIFLIAKVKQVQNGGCVPDNPANPRDCDHGLTRYCLTKQLNEVLGKMEVRRALGTDGIPCPDDAFAGKKADYDVGLRSLIWIIYNFPPRPDGFGLSREVYRHIRDQLLTVHGTSPYKDGDSYSYHLSACGNNEQRQGTPAQHVEQFEQLQKACEALGVSAADCNRAATADPDEDEGCFSSFLCAIAAFILVILAIVATIFSAGLFAIAFAAGTALAAAAAGAAAVIMGLVAVAAVVGIVGLLTVWIPETENHILMIETSRFLSNNLKLRDYRCADPALAAYACDPENNNLPAARQLFDNSVNGHGRWLLTYLQDLLKRDFLEYNSRPYQRYSMAALQNLYDMACAFENPCSDMNLQIKVAARAVLDYVTAKYAVSNSSLKRLAPFRRLLEKKENGLSEPMFGGNTDFNVPRFALLFGTKGIPPCESPDDQTLCLDLINPSMVQLVLTAASTYRPPPLLAELIQVNSLPGGREASGCESVLQRYHHDGEEIYFCERSFLITAGGVSVGPANKVFVFGRSADEGVALPTTLMPHGYGTNWRNDFIRFDGPNEDNSPNLCVERDFACGLNLRIPDAYKDPACYERVGFWHFIDATKCPQVKAEFYVAAAEHPCASALACEDTDNFGLLEVIDSRRASFEEFREFVLTTNDGQATVMKPDRDNVFTRFSGAEVVFDPNEGIIRPEANEDLLADGDVVWSDGSACAVIRHPRINHTIVLSLVDLNNPYVAFIDVRVPDEMFGAVCRDYINFRNSSLFEPGR